MPSVILVPVVFAMPAGLIAIASASSADATAAPARVVDTTPAPGRNNPPADATPEPNNANRTASPLSFVDFIRARPYITVLAREQPDMRQQDSNRCRRDAADPGRLTYGARSDRF